MAEVDPFIQPIPAQFQSDRELRSYYEYLHRFLHDIWVRTGGGNDDITDESIQELYPWQKGLKGNGVLDVIEVSGTTYEANGSQILICNNADELTITLNPEPDHKEQVVIVRNNGPVVVTSNRTISGEITKRILRRYTAPHHIYTIEADAWNVI